MKKLIKKLLAIISRYCLSTLQDSEELNLLVLKLLDNRTITDSRELNAFVLKLLNNKSISTKLWETIHRNNEMFLYINNIHKHMFYNATQKSAEYIMEHTPNALPFYDTLDLLKHSVSMALKNRIEEGLFLEFGVFSGYTVNFIASLIGDERTIHGFDSFEGLSEEWNACAPKGLFDKKGEMPAVSKNVILHKGWFNESIPLFLQSEEIRSKKIAFMHVDSDLYSSAAVIFNNMRHMIVPGTVIQLDEFLNYPGFEQHEFKAFHEFIAETGLKYKMLGFVNYATAAAVIIEE